MSRPAHEVLDDSDKMFRNICLGQGTVDDILGDLNRSVGENVKLVCITFCTRLC